MVGLRERKSETCRNLSFKKPQKRQAHICNPSYSVGKDQRDHGSKPIQANSLQDSISKISNTKTRLVEWLKW
jgi:hypothetical protein